MNERIVVGIDGSKPARAALEWAIEEARLRNATLEVIHSYLTPWESWAVPIAAAPPNEVERAQRDMVDKEVDAVDHSGVRVERIVVKDRPAPALINRAKGASLLVLGSRGLGGFSGLLLGSVSQQVVHHAPCPVTIIPEP